jgi:Zn-dependent protease with chaperone function
MRQSPSGGGTKIILFAMFLVSILILFGFEASLIEHSYLLALTLIFLATVELANLARAFGQIYGARGRIAGKSIRLALKPVPAEVSAFTKDCALKAELHGHLETLYVDQSWDAPLNAYVAKFFGRSFIIISGSLMSLFFSESKLERDVFEFTIFHELGHVAAHDLTTVTRGLMLFIAMIVLFPIKLAIFFFYSVKDVSTAYTSVLPVRGEVITLGVLKEDAMTIMRTIEYPEFVGLSMMIGWYLFGLIVLFFLYRRLVWFRELEADQFARYLTCGRINGEQILRKALSNPSPTLTSPAQSFQGSNLWHPDIKRRVKAYDNSDDTAFVRLSSLILVACLLTYQMFIPHTLNFNPLDEFSVIASTTTVAVFFYISSMWLLFTPHLSITLRKRRTIYGILGLLLPLPFTIWAIINYRHTLASSEFASGSQYYSGQPLDQAWNSLIEFIAVSVAPLGVYTVALLVGLKVGKTGGFHHYRTAKIWACAISAFFVGQFYGFLLTQVAR